jgi:preprotein translocase subunit SecE
MPSVSEYIDQGRNYLNEVLVELRKVHWPNRQETTNFTWVVLIVVTFTSVYLGVVDYLISLAMRLVF